MRSARQGIWLAARVSLPSNFNCPGVHPNSTISVEGVDYFLTVQAPSLRLTLIGAVHISQALAPIAHIAGLEVTIVDPRTALASPTLRSLPSGRTRRSRRRRPTPIPRSACSPTTRRSTTRRS